MPSWPASLPQRFLADGFSEQSPDNVIRSSNSVGPDKIRRRTTASVIPTSGTLRMTTAQLATFRSFYKTDLADGALSFDWVDPFDGATTRSLRIERYSLTTNGASHFLTLNMEVLP